MPASPPAVAPGRPAPPRDAITEIGAAIVAIARAADEDAVVRVLAESVPRLVPADRASVALATPDGALEVRALLQECCVLPVGAALPVDGTAMGEVVTTGVARAFRAEAGSPHADLAAFAAAGARHVVIAPVSTTDGVLGVLAAVSAGHAYGGEDVALMTTLAAAAGAAVERARLLDRARADADRLRADAEHLAELTRIGHAMTAATTVEEVFAVVSAGVSRIAPADRVGYSVITEDGQARIFGLAGEVAPGNVGSSVPVAGSAVEAAIAAGGPVAFDDLAASPHPEHAALRAVGLRSGVVVPVDVGGRVIGTLGVSSREPAAFDAESLATLQALAQIMGTSLGRAAAQEELAANESRTRALIDDSPLMIAALDGDGLIRRASRFAASALGYAADELPGTAFADLHPDDARDEVDRRVANLLAAGDGDVSVAEVRMLKRDGTPVWARQTARVVAAEGGAPEVIVVCEDITEVRALSARVAHQATHDALTGLVNRAEFDQRLEGAIARVRDGGAHACVAFMDLDHFKVINDTCGHRAGDAMLRDLVGRLEACVSRTDTLARFGGDEFALLLEGCRLADALRVVDRLRAAVEEFSFSWEGRAFGLSLSIGITEIDADAHHDVGQIISDVDAACYEAKNAGRNRVVIARQDAEIAEGRRSEAEWVTRTRAALAEERFVLWAQPIVPVAGADARLRFEVLIRMVEDGHLVSPGAFIPAAERFGLAPLIDEWVLRTTVERLAAWPGVLDRIDFCTINLSARSLESEEFLDVALRVLGQAPRVGRRLCFEITETAAMSRMSTALRFIQAVKALGCRIALDDFGNGFASFGYLRHLPLDFIKIDGALVRDVASDPIDRAVVRAVHEMAQAVGLGTIGEFVEDPSILARLAAIGVDYAQGYGVGLPQPIEDLLGS